MIATTTHTAGARPALVTERDRAEADVADIVLRQLDGSGVTYFRWQPSIPESLAFVDQGSVEHINVLEDVARRFIAEHDGEIDLVVELICKPSLLVQSVP